MELHFTLGELSEQWHTSERTLRDWFIDEPGVIRFGVANLTKGRKRAYISLRIPESVALRVYRRMTGNRPAA
jgi:hypothetical protein